MIALSWQQQWNSLLPLSFMFVLRFVLCKGWSPEDGQNAEGIMEPCWGQHVELEQWAWWHLKLAPLCKHLTLQPLIMWWPVPCPQTLLHPVHGICCKNDVRLLSQDPSICQIRFGEFASCVILQEAAECYFEGLDSILTTVTEVQHEVSVTALEQCLLMFTHSMLPACWISWGWNTKLPQYSVRTRLWVVPHNFK